jgi:hypothetical protein
MKKGIDDPGFPNEREKPSWLNEGREKSLRWSFFRTEIKREESKKRLISLSARLTLFMK